MAKTNETASDVAKEQTYSLRELMDASETLGASKDIIVAAFRESGNKEATISEAKRIVNSFKGRKVL